MLIHGSDKERAFDLAVQRSFPYLIFPPIHDSYEGLDYDEFRNKLINNLVALNTYKNSNDDVTFYKQNEEIRNMLESTVFDKTTAAEIESYKYQQMTIDNAIRGFVTRFSEHDIRLSKLEGSLKRVKKLDTDIEKITSDSPIRIGEPPISIASGRTGKNIYPSLNNENIDKRISNVSIVINFLKKYQDSKFTPAEIALATGLKESRVRGASEGIYNRRESIKKSEEYKHFMRYEYSFKGSGINFNREYTGYKYQWVENLTRLDDSLDK
jgi:hypothetical protein